MEEISKEFEQIEMEEEEKKMPLTMVLILCNIFSERFCSAGVQAILAMYFNVKLNLDPTMATSMYHLYEVLFSVFTIAGAIIADSWLGHYKAIVLMQMVYVSSAVIIAIGNIGPLNLSIPIFAIFGLLLMVISNGSIRVNLNVFGANQYKLPEQSALFFSFSYFILKIGSVVARLTVPILKQDVQCFGMSDCYPLAFGSIAVMMMTSSILLVWGSLRYVKKPPSGNMMLKVCGCIFQGIAGKICTVWSQRAPKNHWLDYSEDKFGSEIVQDTKTVVNILLIHLPLPIYYAVYMQQGSRWVFQAKRMNGDFGWFTIKPDQMIVFNSALAIVMIPVCNYVLYPLLARLGLKTYLQKMTIGGLLAACSFIISGFVEIKIQKDFINILWLIPQHFLVATGENFLYVSLVAFAYSEAPASMKSALQAFMYMTIAIGNGIVSLISGAKVFSSLTTEIFFYAAMLVVNQMIFAYLSSNYRSVHIQNADNEEKLLKK